MADDIHCGPGQAAGHRAAADQAALLVREADNLDRVTGRDAAFMHQLRNLDRTDDTDVAVVVAAARHRIDVRAEHDRWQPVFRPFAASDDVARRVDTDLEACLPHKVHDETPPFQIGFGKGDPADAAFGVFAEFAECMDSSFHARRVGRDTRVLCADDG